MIRQQELSDDAGTAFTDFVEILAVSAAYASIADYYEFACDFNVIRVSRADVLRADPRIPIVLDYLRSRLDGVPVLRRTLAMWADPREMIFLTQDEKSGCYLDRSKIPSIEVSDIPGIYFIACSCEVRERISFAPHIWISGPAYELKGTFEVDAAWIDKNFRDGNVKLEVGIALGLSRIALASLLYEPAATWSGQLPSLTELS